jgi:hypothetical protein
MAVPESIAAQAAAGRLDRCRSACATVQLHHFLSTDKEICVPLQICIPGQSLREVDVLQI